MQLQVGHNNIPFYLLQTGKVAHHDKLATGRGEAERAFEVMKHKLASSFRRKSVAAGTCS